MHPVPNRSEATDMPSTHGDLVRSVALGADFVVSGSYDLTIKVGGFALKDRLVGLINSTGLGS